MSTLDDLLSVSSPSDLLRVSQKDLFSHLEREESNKTFLPEYFITGLVTYCQTCEKTHKTLYDIRQRAVILREDAAPLHRMEVCSFPSLADVKKIDISFSKREVLYCHECISNHLYTYIEGNVPITCNEPSFKTSRQV